MVRSSAPVIQEPPSPARLSRFPTTTTLDVLSSTPKTSIPPRIESRSRAKTICSSNLAGGQGEEEGAAHPQLAVDADLPSMGLDDAPAKVEPQAGAGSLLRPVPRIVLLEHRRFQVDG